MAAPGGRIWSRSGACSRQALRTVACRALGEWLPLRVCPTSTLALDVNPPELACLQIPYLEDPNTAMAMFESAAIVSYLRETYGQPSAQGTSAAGRKAD